MKKNDSPVSKVFVKLMKIPRKNLTSLEPRLERSSPCCKMIRIPFLMRCGFLTVDPFVGIPVFIAKLSER